MDEDLLDNVAPQNPEDEEAAVYPVPEDKRIGVSTPIGTPSDSDDDKEVSREQTGIPD